MPRDRLPVILHLALTCALALAVLSPAGAAGASPAAPEQPTGTVLAPRTSAPAPVDERIVNGVLTAGSPSVGFFLDASGAECTGTLIGCRTFLTAAHCICDDGNDAVPGFLCSQRPDLLDPSGKLVYFQHAGIFGVSKVTVDPSFVFGTQGDLAILELSAPVPGVRPSRINQVRRPAFGTRGTIVGFGISAGDQNDAVLKRTGEIQTASCAAGIPNSTHVCWNFSAPLGAPGSNSNTCSGDSGGPLFFDLGSGPVLGGVTSGGNLASCLQGDRSFNADVFVERAWVQQAAGTDLHRIDCGPLAFAGEAGGTIVANHGNLSASNRDDRFSVAVPAGLSRLVVTLNGADVGDFDLYVRRGAQPTPANADCASENQLTLESCVFDAPAAGTYNLLVSRYAGSGAYQVTATLFTAASGGGGGGGGGNGGPAPPAGPWLASPELPGFEAKALISDTTAGSREADCIPEALCLSGALAGRPEIFVKVIGPRPNGYLWTQLSRFTPSKVEIWLRQTSTGQINYYLLPAVGAASDDVSGLQDREAFVP